jgi:hypothetical protein
MGSIQHENLVKLFTSFCEGNMLWIVMELMDVGEAAPWLRALSRR